MPPVRSILRAALWSWGLGYVVLWGLAIWALGETHPLWRDPACRADANQVVFYFDCGRAGAIAALAMLTNWAFTFTIWAPVYIAAATVRADALAVALPVVASHVLGLPAAVYVAMRTAQAGFARLRRA